MRIETSAPTRIDLAGGTIDIWPLYLFHPPAVTLNAAISLRAHCRLESRSDGRVVLVSDDTGERVEADTPDALDVDTLPLVARLVKHFGARGITVTTRSDSPVGAGIAGSSAMNIALVAALAEAAAKSPAPPEPRIRRSVESSRTRAEELDRRDRGQQGDADRVHAVWGGSVGEQHAVDGLGAVGGGQGEVDHLAAGGEPASPRCRGSAPGRCRCRPAP